MDDQSRDYRSLSSEFNATTGAGANGFTTSMHEPPEEMSDAEIEHFVRAIIKSRRKRDALFPPGLFGEPAWDMLLELYAAKLAYRQEFVSSLCIASAVPATTALRWIVVLENAGLVERRADRFDRRRTFVSLTDKGQSALEEFFSLPQLAMLCPKSSANGSMPSRASGSETSSAGAIKRSS